MLIGGKGYPAELSLGGGKEEQEYAVSGHHRRL
jgi:hypothetical protein